MAPANQLPRLGELESDVLEHLWTVGEADVAETHRRIGAPRGITANTVGSALERLHRKGLADRRKVSHAYRYTPTVSRDTFAARRLLDAAGDAATLTRAGLLSAFVDLVAEQDHASLDRLEALIAEKREQENSR